ncbi:MAG: DUF4830 domain-containing protein [Candidatus Methanoperedens sp.]|nr:DUF4830 domain-containing protein [Candidatus Methanoperedens sp.]
MKYLMFLSLISLVIIIGCVDTQPQKETLVQEELDKVGIRTSGFNKQLSVNLPETFSDANWGLKKIICEEGGYDLAKYANQAVNIYSYRSNRYYEKEQLNVWVITDENEVICMYLTVGESSGQVPGVFSVNDPNVIVK